MTRVLFVDHSSTMGGGQLGLSRYLLEHESVLERQVLLLGDGEFARRLERGGIRHRVLADAPDWWRKAGAIHRVARLIEEIAPDVVVTNSLTAANIVGLGRRSAATHLAYLREDLSRASLGRLKRAAMTRVTLPRFDGFVANSAYTAATVPDVLRRRPLEIAYPVSGTRSDAPVRPGEADGILTVCSLSRLDRWKGVHVLIEAAGRLATAGLGDRFRFVIAGGSAHADPRYAGDLVARAVRSGARIEFLGHVDDVDAVLDRSDVLALCTLRPEPFGQVVVQALTRGRVVVATAGGGPDELLRAADAGVLVEPGDAAALAEALRDLLLSPDAAAGLVHRGRTLLSALDDETTARRLDEAVLQLHAAVQAGAR